MLLQRTTNKEELFALGKQFGIEGIIGEPLKEKKSNINDLYVLTTNKGVYMLRGSKKPLSRKAQEKRSLEYHITDHLQKVGFPYETPQFLTTREGQQTIITGERMWDAYQRLKGTTPKKGRKTLQRIIQLMTAYHEAMETFPTNNKSEAPRTYDPKSWVPGKIKSLAMNASPNIRNIIDENVDYLLNLYHIIKENFTPGENTTLSHADLHAGNLLERKTVITGVLDFENAHWSPKIYDLVKLSDGEEERDEFMIREYERHRPLSKEEKEELLPSKTMKTIQSVAWKAVLYDEERATEQIQKALGILKLLEPRIRRRLAA